MNQHQHLNFKDDFEMLGKHESNTTDAVLFLIDQLEGRHGYKLRPISCIEAGYIIKVESDICLRFTRKHDNISIFIRNMNIIK